MGSLPRTQESASPLLGAYLLSEMGGISELGGVGSAPRLQELGRHLYARLYSRCSMT